MCFEDLIPVVVGFLLGLVGGPIKDYITDKQKARRLTRMINVELEGLSSRLEDTTKRLELAEGPASWYERSVTFTESWFWNQADVLALLSRKMLGQLVMLRSLLKQLESDYREIEQDIGADGRVFPRERVLRSFERIRGEIRSRTDKARELIHQICRD